MAQEDVTRDKLARLAELLKLLDKEIVSRKTNGDGAGAIKARTAMAQVDVAIASLEAKVYNCKDLVGKLDSK